jgi:hypothetical protein
LDWIKKDHGTPEHPMRNPAAAAKLLAELRGVDPLAALKDLTAWLDAVKALPGREEKIRNELLSLIEEASYPHLAVLLAQYFAKPTDKQTERESAWHPLSNYLLSLTSALCQSSAHLLKEAVAQPSLRLPAASDAARALHACRLLLKFHLVRYQDVPRNLWHMAYTVHRLAEAADCAGMPVRMHATQKSATTVNHELVRLLMLPSSSPEMLTPGQIEVADWVIEQLGEHFTLRPPGVADNPFCFDPAGDSPPQRAPAEHEEAQAGLRYFGTGLGYDALERIHKQLVTTGSAEVGTFGKSLAPHLQLSAIQHLVAFWGEKPPYTPPQRTPATAKLQVTHGYAQTWQHLSHVRSATSELTLAEDGDVPDQAPESWTLQDTGGSELGVAIPHRAGDPVNVGDVVAVSTGGNGRWWLGVIRSLHAEPGLGLHANIFVMSRDPQAMQMRAVIAKGEEHAFTEKSARQFAFNSVRGIILSDGSAGSQPPNMLLPPDSWKEGRVFEATMDGGPRYLRVARALRHGDDYLRVTFEWVAQG